MAVQPALVLEISWHVLRRWIDTESFDFIEPATTLGLGQLRPAPGAVVDDHEALPPA